MSSANNSNSNNSNNNNTVSSNDNNQNNKNNSNKGKQGKQGYDDFLTDLVRRGLAMLRQGEFYTAYGLEENILQRHLRMPLPRPKDKSAPLHLFLRAVSEIEDDNMRKLWNDDTNNNRDNENIRAARRKLLSTTKYSKLMNRRKEWVGLIETFLLEGNSNNDIDCVSKHPTSPENGKEDAEVDDDDDKASGKSSKRRLDMESTAVAKKLPKKQRIGGKLKQPNVEKKSGGNVAAIPAAVAAAIDEYEKQYFTPSMMETDFAKPSNEGLSEQQQQHNVKTVETNNDTTNPAKRKISQASAPPKRMVKQNKGKSKPVITKELMEQKRTEVKTEFEARKLKILEEVPNEVKQRFRQMGFVKWTKAYLPVLILSPFDVPPETVRLEWMKMFENCKKQGRLKDMTNILYWYGTSNIDQTYSFEVTKNIVPYDIGVRKGYDKVPARIQKLVDSNATLLKRDEDLYKGLQEIAEDAVKDPSERLRGILDFPEEYDLITEQDYVFDYFEDDFDTEESDDDDEKERAYLEGKNDDPTTAPTKKDNIQLIAGSESAPTLKPPSAVVTAVNNMAALGETEMSDVDDEGFLELGPPSAEDDEVDSIPMPSVKKISAIKQTNKRKLPMTITPKKAKLAEASNTTKVSASQLGSPSVPQTHLNEDGSTEYYHLEAANQAAPSQLSHASKNSSHSFTTTPVITVVPVKTEMIESPRKHPPTGDDDHGIYTTTTAGNGGGAGSQSDILTAAPDIPESSMEVVRQIKIEGDEMGVAIPDGASEADTSISPAEVPRVVDESTTEGVLPPAKHCKEADSKIIQTDVTPGVSSSTMKGKRKDTVNTEHKEVDNLLGNNERLFDQQSLDDNGSTNKTSLRRATKKQEDNRLATLLLQEHPNQNFQDQQEPTPLHPYQQQPQQRPFVQQTSTAAAVRQPYQDEEEEKEDQLTSVKSENDALCNQPKTTPHEDGGEDKVSRFLATNNCCSHQAGNEKHAYHVADKLIRNPYSDEGVHSGFCCNCCMSTVSFAGAIPPSYHHRQDHRVAPPRRSSSNMLLSQQNPSVPSQTEHGTSNSVAVDKQVLQSLMDRMDQLQDQVLRDKLCEKDGEVEQLRQEVGRLQRVVLAKQTDIDLLQSTVRRHEQTIAREKAARTRQQKLLETISCACSDALSTTSNDEEEVRLVFASDNNDGGQPAITRQVKTTMEQQQPSSGVVGLTVEQLQQLLVNAAAAVTTTAMASFTNTTSLTPRVASSLPSTTIHHKTPSSTEPPPPPPPLSKTSSLAPSRVVPATFDCPMTPEEALPTQTTLHQFVENQTSREGVAAAALPTYTGNSSVNNKIILPRVAVNEQADGLVEDANHSALTKEKQRL